ncbi:hypothetical protein E4634_01950 [Mangrovimicrobium sediminis]|uniref:SGNH hydrolase-type esterase domain-containing protein n=1 Tax=Mangrovimicrobium sediminis TaxID=2562682 RepID=A0A4Z0M883_9GAMM|nr:hypothetical protein [Haliea sp. SAOS-164]TGD75674.1 hypothetical protein E4634_01950 [Haliea sp. SAOS-164]
MIPWRVLRAICLVLLLAPVVHLTYLVARDTTATLDASPEAWAPHMAAYVREDQSTTLPERPIEVVGGHRVTLWRGLEPLLAPRPVLMRGLGNATIDDIAHHYERLVAYYRPDTLVVMPGDSDFHLRDNKDAAQLAGAVRDLVALDAGFARTRRIYVISPLKTPLHPGDRERVEASTRLLQEWARGDARVEILDANALLCDAEGNPDPAYFRFDGLNLNEHGYLRLSLLLKSALEAEEPIAGNAET